MKINTPPTTQRKTSKSEDLEVFPWLGLVDMFRNFQEVSLEIL